MKNSYSLKEIATFVNIEYIGNPDKLITHITNLENVSENSLLFLFDSKYLEQKIELNNSAILIKKGFEDKFNNDKLISDNPKLDMAKILSLFEYDYQKFYDYQNVYIGSNVTIGQNVSISPFTYIGQNSFIADNVTIMSNCFIGDNSSIGQNSKIYPNVSIMSNTKIGEQVIIQSNSVIGSDGYGYIQTEGNNHYKIPQIGNVILEDKVEIGSNVSIDRATIGSTVIKQGTKIDNMVHIAHNVSVGERSLIIAQTGIAGSTNIGNDTVIAGQSGIAGHLNIGSQSLIMGRSGVTKSFPSQSKLSGFPARDHKADFKEKALIKKIPDLIKEIENLKIQLANKNQL